MTESTKIEFRYRRVSQLDDITDLVAMLFPGNRNQQHAAARILMALKASDELVESLSFLEDKHAISRRTLQRARAKLSRLGLIEHVTWMNRNYHGRQGWKLSSRMGTALRQFADHINTWRKDDRPERKAKDEMLVGVLA